MTKTILVTGGAGYVGSHTTLELLNAGYNVVVVDNMTNAQMSSEDDQMPESLRRVQELTGRTVSFHRFDIRDKKALDSTIFKQYQIDCVAHFAALKSVGESNRVPMQYYSNNISGTSVLAEVMAKNNVFQMVYSSSATVYGDPTTLPITEAHSTGNCTNPYGKTKYFTEEILKDICLSDPRWSVIALRYFNPVGAHPSGRIGEDPKGEPCNLMPFISQVAVARLPCLNVYGNDYETVDGTGVRDYIHVMDLAEGHVRALEKLATLKGFGAYNLGTGAGTSVLEMVKAFEKASNKSITYKVCARRPGDVAASYADVTLARRELNWVAKLNVDRMCEDTWRWQSQNPNGYVSAAGQNSRL